MVPLGPTTKRQKREPNTSDDFSRVTASKWTSILGHKLQNELKFWGRNFKTNSNFEVRASKRIPVLRQQLQHKLQFWSKNTFDFKLFEKNCASSQTGWNTVPGTGSDGTVCLGRIKSAPDTCVHFQEDTTAVNGTDYKLHLGVQITGGSYLLDEMHGRWAWTVLALCSQRVGRASLCKKNWFCSGNNGCHSWRDGSPVLVRTAWSINPKHQKSEEVAHFCLAEMSLEKKASDSTVAVAGIVEARPVAAVMRRIG